PHKNLRHIKGVRFDHSIRGHRGVVGRYASPLCAFSAQVAASAAAITMETWRCGAVICGIQRGVSLMSGRPTACRHHARRGRRRGEELNAGAARDAGRQVANEGVTSAIARTYYEHQELFSFTLAAAGRAGCPPFVTLSQSRTGQVLAEQMAATPLIEQRWG